VGITVTITYLETGALVRVSYPAQDSEPERTETKVFTDSARLLEWLRLQWP
jgi:hypothetical protein